MAAVNAPVPTDPASPWSAVDPPRQPRRLERRVVAVVLLLGWVAMSLSLLVGVRHADADDLRNAVAHDAVASPELWHRRPDGLGQWIRLPRSQDDGGDSASCTSSDGSSVDCSSSRADPDSVVAASRDTWLVWRDGPGRTGERWMSVADAASALGTRPTGTAVMSSLYRRGASGGFTWSLPGLVGLCLLFTIVAGARPRTGTRWFWFWVSGMPAGAGLLWYVAAECWSGPTPNRRRSGWWGLLIVLVAQFGLLVLLQGLGLQS